MSERDKKLEVDYIIIENNKKENLDISDIKDSKKIIMNIILKEEDHEK